jgi:2-polyprenyl-3-methyl-5-hydroxy-6-metoxy-1,4-benzoquinol methylase
MKNNELRIANKEIRKAWDTNAVFWDERMGEGNNFFNILERPAILLLLYVRAAHSILDIATVNGLTARRLASLSVQVTAFDFSARLIELAKTRPNPDARIAYHVIDGTDEKALRSLGAHAFDAALCNMALFDIAEIEPLFRSLPKILRAGAAFIFTICHPAFNNSSSVHIAEEQDQQRRIQTVFSVKTSCYMNPYTARIVAIRDQPVAQLYFERPLQYYFNLGFANGFVLDGFEECAFPLEQPQENPLPFGIGLAAEQFGLGSALWILLAGALALLIGLPRRGRSLLDGSG